MRTHTRVSLATLLGALLVAGTAQGDDKDLLKRSAVPPNLMIVLANANSTATPLTGVAGATGSMWDGDADSYNSKLGAAKRVIKQFVRSKRGSVNFGLSTFDHNPNRGSIDTYIKHWLYSPTTDDFCSTQQNGQYTCDTFFEPKNTIERWGLYGEGPCATITANNNQVTPPSCAGVSPYVVYPKTTGTLPKYFGNLAASKSVVVTLSTTEQLLVTLEEGDYGDAYTDGTLTKYLRDPYAVKVHKEYQKYDNASGKYVTQAQTPGKNPADVHITYIPSPARPTASGALAGLPPDGDHFFTSAPDAGEAIGFLSLTSGYKGNGDMDVSANCSGWEFQSNSAPVPLVKIPRDYTWGNACDKQPQNSIPCVSRLLRPQGVLVRYAGAGAGTQYLASPTGGFDHDNPGYYTAAGDVNADGCDPSLRGAVDQGLDIAENQAVLTNGNASQVPLANLLQNALDYFNTPAVDGFYGGSRQDDPNKSCRKSAVVLVYDSFNGCQNSNCSPGGTTSPIEKVAAGFAKIHVPVYVIGYGAINSTQAATGQCIAYNTLAKRADESVGYFPVTDEASLSKAFAEVTDKLVEASQDFASSSISSVQAGSEQMAFLASFNAAKSRSIWTGRINGYLLSADGTLPTLPYDVTDPVLGTYTIQLPSNDKSVLMWNAGENLAATNGTGGAKGGTVMPPGDTLQTGTYNDTSTASPSTIPTYFYKGRKIVWSLPSTYDNPPTALPIPAAATVPETRLPFVGDDAQTTWWPTLKTLLGPQTSPPAVVTLGDTDAQNAIRFIWGDRDAVTGATIDGDKYNGKKLGDIFHSNPAIVAGPATYPYYAANKNGYIDFYNKFRHRRRILYAGANDGLLHAFDVGAWDRYVQPAPCAGQGPPAECYDLGTGAELFAYAPRAIMQIYKPLKDAVGPQTKFDEWTVDGPPSVADVYIDPEHSGSPTAADRVWQTVLVGGVREGSPFEGTSGAAPRGSYGSYYALNITQPDELVTVNGATTIATGTGLTASPKCLDKSFDATCARDWPTVMWEISDRTDDDGNTFADMGESWSKPNLGLVKICKTGCGTSSATYDEKYVAIFGGGFDRERKNRRGNWLYMVDIETGYVLMKTNGGCSMTGGTCTPTYFGSVPSETSSVDYNQDGTLDAIYFGDLKGQMWRIDLTDLRYLASPPTTRYSNKIAMTAGSPAPRPFLLFQAPQTLTVPNSTALQFFPIYYRPSVIFLADTANGTPVVGVAFGTGDRDDITAAMDGTSLKYAQRFYYVVDDHSNVTRTETDLGSIGCSSAPNLTPVPAKGWYLMLAKSPNTNCSGATYGERLITDVLTVSGVVNFGTYSPVNSGTGTAACSNSVRCGDPGGTSYFYTVYYANGNPVGATRATESTGTGGSFLTNPIFFTSADNKGHIFWTTSGGSPQQQKPKTATSTIIKEWKEQ